MRLPDTGTGQHNLTTSIYLWTLFPFGNNRLYSVQFVIGLLIPLVLPKRFDIRADGRLIISMWESAGYWSFKIFDIDVSTSGGLNFQGGTSDILKGAIGAVIKMAFATVKNNSKASCQTKRLKIWLVPPIEWAVHLMLIQEILRTLLVFDFESLLDVLPERSPEGALERPPESSWERHPPFVVPGGWPWCNLI
ncbi:hypothetical protein CAPTEDRAFT_208931 [Capitella teleta]|uniref:Uncharacterized protein n=1 Tax=Capitella teleta TaxID=283909 RepID=R7V0D4_CAPTE|nr:hypothetical protein CAPTEDRAFT_208931 [Capitella teleta]|eukprot:ELU12293.1 hypothetical protein CAPTEDRAFT_208931 [Capitella teleta]